MRIRNTDTGTTRFENIEITVMYDIHLFLWKYDRSWATELSTRLENTCARFI